MAVQDDAWNAVIEDIQALCHKAVRAASDVLQAPQSGELSLAFLSDDAIQALNKAYRGKDKPTNVLSFPGDDFNPAMGDIILAFETVDREAADKKISIADHTAHLLIHGYLHLTGYDHETDADAATMEALEIRALESLGLKNPYESNENV